MAYIWSLGDVAYILSQTGTYYVTRNTIFKAYYFLSIRLFIIEPARHYYAGKTYFDVPYVRSQTVDPRAATSTDS